MDPRDAKRLIAARLDDAWEDDEIKKLVSNFEAAIANDPRMVNSEKLRQRVSRNLMMLITTADDDPWDDQWDWVGFFISQILQDIIFAVMARWHGRGARMLKVIGGEKGLRDVMARRGHVIHAIEAALREDRKFWKAGFTDTKRVNMVLAMFLEMYCGATREEALKIIGARSKSSANQYAARVRQRVLSGEFGPVALDVPDIVNVDMRRLTPKKRKPQFARSTDARRKRH
jgi:hypothetical protein